MSPTPVVTLAFTASPWEIDRAKMDGSEGHYYQIDATHQSLAGLPLTVADTLNRDSSIDPDEDRANALLLAAAPDLALALLAGLGIESGHGDGPIPSTAEWEMIARAALKKAGVLA